MREFVLKFVSASIEGVFGLLFFILIVAAASSDDWVIGLYILLIGFSTISFIFWIFLCIIDIRETLHQIADSTSKIIVIQEQLMQNEQNMYLDDGTKNQEKC